MATIQWFPGHMAKAKRQVQEQLKAVDAVIELRDARIPESSKNPLIDHIIGNKRRIIVLNKSDLADPAQTKLWMKGLKGQETDVLALDSKNPNAIKRFRKDLLAITQDKREKWLKKGMKHKLIRLMVVGIPNVGKSTFINQLTQKKIAQVGNKPGVTKGQQWIQIDKDFALLDTPGILWPKFEDEEVGKRLALTGAIKDTHYYSDDIALFALEFLLDYYPSALRERCHLTEEEACPPYPDLLMTLTEKLGMKDDYERASDWLIRELREGRIAPVTLDRFEDYLMVYEKEEI